MASLLSGPSSRALLALLAAIAVPSAGQDVAGRPEHRLIASVTADREGACLGEPVRVRVGLTAAGQQASVTVAGVPGIEASLQFSGEAGPRDIQVVARVPGGEGDAQVASIDYSGPCTKRRFLMIDGRRQGRNPMLVRFTIGNLAELSKPLQIYEWDFGDEKRATTRVPFVVHDYAEVLREGEVPLLATTVRVSGDGGEASGARSFVLAGPGLVMPRLSLMPGEEAGALRLKVAQPRQAMRFTLVREEFPCGPGAPFLSPIVLQPTDAGAARLDMEKGANGEEQQLISLPAGQDWIVTLPPSPRKDDDTCAIAIHQAGEAADHTPVRGYVYREIRSPPALKPSAAAISPDFLELLGIWKLVPVTDSISLSDLQLLVDLGLVLRDDRGRWNLTAAGFQYIRSNSLFPAQSQPGPVCSGTGSPGQKCKPSGWRYFAGYLSNARKGDALLTGGCGLISDLLRGMGQKYSHTALMATDRDRIVQGYAVTERYSRHASLGAKAVVPGWILKYGWNGRMGQSVDEAIHGAVVGPRLSVKGETYGPQSPFQPASASCADGAQDLPLQLVVKPPLAVEMSAAGAKLRARLQGVADAAEKFDVHYRLGAFSRADRSLDPGEKATADCDWCGGTDGVMCASFIWTLMWRAKIPMGHRPHAFGAHGEYTVDAGGGALDGLFRYPASYREDGARLIRTAIYDRIVHGDLVGWTFGKGVAGGVADQATNCFVSDSCDKPLTGHERDWTRPGEGYTVSPTDMLWWDTAQVDGSGGPYGYAEQLDYLSGRYEMTYQWQ